MEQSEGHWIYVILIADESVFEDYCKNMRIVELFHTENVSVVVKNHKFDGFLYRFNFEECPEMSILYMKNELRFDDNFNQYRSLYNGFNILYVSESNISN
jgi:hypothetical protein